MKTRKRTQLLALLGVAATVLGGVQGESAENDETVRIAQATTTPTAPLAQPLSADELRPLYAAIPSTDVVGLGVVHVGELLSPQTLDMLMQGVLAVEPSAPLGRVQEMYEESIRPIATAVRSCVVWVTNEPGLACEGDFAATGLDLASLTFGDCGAGDDTCGESDTLYPGHHARWVTAPRAAVLIDDRFLVMAVEPERTHASVVSLLQALADPTGVAVPVIAGAPLDAEPTVSAVFSLPPEAQSAVSQLLGRPFSLGGVRVMLDVSAMPEALFQLTASVGDPTAATDLRQALAGLVTLSLAADPASARLLGDDPLAAIDEILQTRGDEIIMRFEGQRLTGVLAAVAVPAFVRYVDRSRSAEAAANLGRLYDGAEAYYRADHVDASGNPLSPQFPAAAPLTPPVVPCGEEVLTPPEAWETPSWTALSFAVSEPHRYSYELTVSGEGASQRFTASAIGDLDCDGIRSTFRRSGTVEGAGAERSVRELEPQVINEGE